MRPEPVPPAPAAPCGKEKRMSTKVIRSKELKMDAMDLQAFLEEVFEDQSLIAVYVQDDTGRTFERVRLEEETLTDGSKVHNIVLSD
jgi:hypothetical protein